MRKHSYYKPEKEAVIKFPDGREVCTNTAAGKREYDARRVELWLRQEGLDAITGEWVDLQYGQFDHEAGRGSGSGHRDDRIVKENGEWQNAMLAPKTNLLKGSKRYQWVDGKYLPVPSRVELAKEVA